jgi:hypothetical protein
MKSIVSASVLLLLFLVLNPSIAARDVSIDLRLIRQNVNVGDGVSVNVNIDQVSDLKGNDILISFDNLRLEYRSITRGVLIDSFVEDIVPDPEISKTTGKIEYLAVLEAPGPGIDSPGGTMLTLDFVARSPGEAWIRLDPNDVCLGDSMANAIPTVVDTERHTIQIGEILSLKRVFNYPNPAPDAEGNTVIRCEALALLEGLEARIYDISGELVKTIGDDEDFSDINAPIYEYVWDCKNGAGQDVANGTYILWLKASFSDDEHETKTWKIAIRR